MLSIDKKIQALQKEMDNLILIKEGGQPLKKEINSLINQYKKLQSNNKIVVDIENIKFHLIAYTNSLDNPADDISVEVHTLTGDRKSPIFQYIKNTIDYDNIDFFLDTIKKTDEYKKFEKRCEDFEENYLDFTHKYPDFDLWEHLD